MQEMDEEKLKEIYGDPNKMLNTTISTVMHLASGDINKIPLSHYWWTETYLETVINESGEELPNMKGILKYLKHIKMQIKLNHENNNVIEQLSSVQKSYINNDMDNPDYLTLSSLTLGGNIASTNTPTHQKLNKQNETMMSVEDKYDTLDKMIFFRPVLGLWNSKLIFKTLVNRLLLNK